jgi:hypothetical protein
MNFKTHMIAFADSESFTTLCGIQDDCSEKFNDANPLVPFGYEKETTCKKCISKYKKSLQREQELEQEFLQACIVQGFIKVQLPQSA